VFVPWDLARGTRDGLVTKNRQVTPVVGSDVGSFSFASHFGPGAEGGQYSEA